MITSPYKALSRNKYFSPSVEAATLHKWISHQWKAGVQPLVLYLSFRINGEWRSLMITSHLYWWKLNSSFCFTAAVQIATISGSHSGRRCSAAALATTAATAIFGSCSAATSCRSCVYTTRPLRSQCTTSKYLPGSPLGREISPTFFFAGTLPDYHRGTRPVLRSGAVGLSGSSCESRSSSARS